VEIDLLVCDIDGCLSAGVGRPLDFGRLEQIAQMNRDHRAGKPVPAGTLCTGRQFPYTELFCQIIDNRVPCVFEHGCGIYDPMSYRVIANVDPGVRDLIQQARDLVHTEMEDVAFIQAGKEFSHSVFPLDGVDLDTIGEGVTAIVDELGPRLHCSRSSECYEILPATANKGSGLRKLAEMTGVAVEKMAGIGDSPNDQPFLDLVGYSAAPANGWEGLKVDFRAPSKDIAGVLEFIQSFSS